MKLTFIGLGVMGYPMAGHLQKAGFDVCVYNRTTEKAQKWAKEFGGTYAETPALASEHADIVLICVGNDNDVRSMIVGTGDQLGILSTIKTCAIIVDHTTTSDTLAKEMAKTSATQGVKFIDAPLSGGQAGAENAQLAIMVGGDKGVLAEVEPVLNTYAKSLQHMGDVGAGQSTKMVNQVLIAGVLQGIAEGFVLSKKSGLDFSQVVDAISAGAAGSWQLSNRGTNIDKDVFDYGFAIDWMCKDLGFCLDAAKRYDIKLPNTESVIQRYKELQSKGLNRCDTSILVKQYENL
jgi:3-hydroxyisobutyrate dehydrogenase